MLFPRLTQRLRDTFMNKYVSVVELICFSRFSRRELGMPVIVFDICTAGRTFFSLIAHVLFNGHSEFTIILGGNFAIY